MSVSKKLFYKYNKVFVAFATINVCNIKRCGEIEVCIRNLFVCWILSLFILLTKAATYNRDTLKLITGTVQIAHNYEKLYKETEKCV